MKRNAALQVARLVVGQMQANCYLVYDLHTREAVIIDPGEDDEYIMDKIQRLELKPTQIVATHGHFDHILAGFSIQKTFNIPFTIHKNDRFLVDQMVSSANHFLGFTTHAISPIIDRILKTGESIKVGRHSLVLIQTPGHTPGSISLVDHEGGFVIAGDTIFAGGSVGRTDFSYSNIQELKQSIHQLLSLPPSTIIYTGHGEPTTVSTEAKYHGVN